MGVLHIEVTDAFEFILLIPGWHQHQSANSPGCTSSYQMSMDRFVIRGVLLSSVDSSIVIGRRKSSDARDFGSGSASRLKSSADRGLVVGLSNSSILTSSPS